METSQKQLHNQLAELSPDQKQEMIQEMAETTEQPKPRCEYAQPGVLRRKKIFKGKMAPQGTVYLVLTVQKKVLDRNGINRNSAQLCAYQLVRGHLSPEIGSNIADSLRALIHQKYKV